MRSRAPVLAAALAAIFLALSPGTPAAAAGEAEEAKALYQKATGEFGVGNYEQAAAHYEAAFQLRPEAALLFNAAQAYRLAGKKKRALELYKNFLRIYGGASQAPEARRHIAALTKQIAEEHDGAPQAGSAPLLLPIANSAPPASAPAPPPPSTAAPALPRPAAPAPPAAAPPPPRAAAPAAPPPPRPAASLVVAPAAAPAAPAREGGSIFRSPWLWVGVGVVLLGAAAFVIARGPSYPDPSFGAGNGD